MEKWAELRSIPKEVDSTLIRGPNSVGTRMGANEIVLVGLHKGLTYCGGIIRSLDGARRPKRSNFRRDLGEFTLE